MNLWSIVVPDSHTYNTIHDKLVLISCLLFLFCSFFLFFLFLYTNFISTFLRCRLQSICTRHIHSLPRYISVVVYIYRLSNLMAFIYLFIILVIVVLLLSRLFQFICCFYFPLTFVISFQRFHIETLYQIVTNLILAISHMLSECVVLFMVIRLLLLCDL